MSPQPRTPTPVRRRRRLHPVAISLIAIAATVFVIFYAFNQGLPFVHRFTLHALVSNSVNLRADSPVRVAGIDVGSVTSTSPAGNATNVTFTMDDAGLPIHTDATLRVRDRLFLEGGYYLELDPGTPAAKIAPDGFTIPEQNTAAPVQFYNLLSTFNSAARSSLEHLLNTFNQGFSALPGHPASSGGAGGLKAAIPSLTPVLRDTALVARGLRGVRPGDVETLLASAGNVAATLARNEGALTGLIHGLNVTSTALASTDGAVAATVAGLDQTVQAAPASLASIDRALPPLTELAGALDPSLKVAPPIVTSLTNAVRELGAVVAPAERGPLVRSLNATFTQFPSILRLLASAFPITRQVTDCLTTHVTPLLNETVPDGALSTGRPVWQDFVHFLPNIASASGNFDADGPYTRVLVGAGTNSVSGGLLNTLPIVSQLVGSAPPGGGSVLGASPQWAGPLTANAFHPEVPCTSDKVPSLGSPAAASDLTTRHTSAVSRPLTLPGLQALAARDTAAVTPGGKP